MPFYYRKNDNNTFKFEIAGSKKGWSVEALKWLSLMAFHPNFQKSNGERYPLFCCVTGEKEVTVKKHTYKVDGFVETENRAYFLEFFGCRLVFHGLIQIFCVIQGTTLVQNVMLNVQKILLRLIKKKFEIYLRLEKLYLSEGVNGENGVQI